MRRPIILLSCLFAVAWTFAQQTSGKEALVKARAGKNVTTHFPRKVVMEEATGTWCGWCPRGIAGIKTMSERYPDNFIAIAIHDDEYMLPTESYYPFLNLVSAFPSSQINRSFWQDPSPFNIDGMKDSGEAMIKADAGFTDDGKVEVSTETTFGFSDNGTEYRIAYVVVEDNVGPYYQANYYSSESPDGLMDWWTQQDSYVQTAFDEVARAIYDYNGVPGQLPQEITEGEVYKCKYTLVLPNNVQNVENVKIVTLLLDNSTGEILNADRTVISKTSVAIEGIQGEMVNVFDVYNLSGVKIRSQVTTLNGLPKGIYIVNGKKVIVK